MEAVVWHGEGWAAPCDIAQDTNMKMTTTTQSIPARSSPGTRTAPSVAGNQDRSMRLMDQSRNVRSLRAAGEVEELTHEMKEYQWNILGLCEVRWKNFGETSTPEGHKLFFSGREDRHEHGAEFLIHKDTVNAIMGCRTVSNRLITIRLKASPFNVIIIQAYAPKN